jgi:precorrin-3B synthase
MTALVLDRATLVKGWCPSAARPMLSGDGYLTRLAPPARGYDGAALASIARLSARLGNGAIEITQRGNLQLRGFSAGSAEEFLIEAQALDLLASDPPVTTLVDPGPDFDAAACIEGEPIAVLLHAAIAPGLRLPPKFVVVIETGGRFGFDAVEADLRLSCLSPRIWRIGITGTKQKATTVFTGDRDEVMAILVRLIAAAAGETRPTQADRADWLERAGLTPDPTIREAPSKPAAQPDDAARALHPAYGRFDADALAAFADAVLHAGARLRPGGGRSLLLAGPRAATLFELGRIALSIGLDTPADDARRSMAVCIGARGCANGSTDTLADADRIAREAPVKRTGKTLHIAGCPKGCAHPAAADTLVAIDGIYRFKRAATAFEAQHGEPVTIGAAA